MLQLMHRSGAFQDEARNWQKVASFHVSMLAPIKFPSNRCISHEFTCTLLIKDVDMQQGQQSDRAIHQHGQI